MINSADSSRASDRHHSPAGSEAAYASEDVPLDQRTRDQLYTIARTLDIPGRGRMNKQQLIIAIRDQR